MNDSPSTDMSAIGTPSIGEFDPQQQIRLSNLPRDGAGFRKDSLLLLAMPEELQAIVLA